MCLIKDLNNLVNIKYTLRFLVKVYQTNKNLSQNDQIIT